MGLRRAARAAFCTLSCLPTDSLGATYRWRRPLQNALSIRPMPTSCTLSPAYPTSYTNTVVHAFRQRVLANASPPGRTNPESNSARRARPRPASAGLLYFRAHLNRDGGRVVAAPRERRGAEVAGRNNGAAKSRLPSQGDQNDAPKSAPWAGGTAPGADGFRPGRTAGPSTAMSPRGGTSSRATGSGDVPSSKSATREEGCGGGPMDTAAAPKPAFDRRLPFLPGALPSNLLRPPRKKLGTEGRTGVGTLRVEGTGGDPRIWESVPLAGQDLQRVQAEAKKGGATAAVATAATYPLSSDGDSDLLASGSCRMKTTTAAARSASGTVREVTRLHRRAASTLEMMSAMAHVLPSVPPECVQGFEISTPANNARPASSSPRRIRTRGGIDQRVTGGDGHHDEETRSPHKQEDFRDTTEGRAIQHVDVPYTPLLKSFSWAGEDEGKHPACRNGGVALQVFSEQMRQRRGGDDPRELPGAEILQLHLNDASGINAPRQGTIRGGGGGEEEGVCGEDEPPIPTPFSR